MAQNYGYEFLMTELPTYMKQILRFSIKEVRLADLNNFLPTSLLRNFFFFSKQTERNSFVSSISRHVDLIYIPFDDSRLAHHH